MYSPDFILCVYTYNENTIESAATVCNLLKYRPSSVRYRIVTQCLKFCLAFFSGKNERLHLQNMWLLALPQSYQNSLSWLCHQSVSDLNCVIAKARPDVGSKSNSVTSCKLLFFFLEHLLFVYSCETLSVA